MCAYIPSSLVFSYYITYSSLQARIVTSFDCNKHFVLIKNCYANDFSIVIITYIGAPKINSVEKAELIK